jgi:hypothetical protein
MASALRSEDKAAVEEALRELLNQESGSVEVCEGLLGALKTHPQLGSKVAEVLASFARDDVFRDVAVSCGVVPALYPLLTSDDKTAQLQSLRAIGNLCFNHDGNRELVLSSGGCPLLVNQLTSCTLLPAEKEHDRLKCVSCGCLLNVVNENAKLCEEMLGLKAVQQLSTLLATPGEEVATVDMGLRALHVLVTSASRQPALIFPTTLASAFSHLLERCVAGFIDVLESLLETVEVAISASDEVKVAVVDAGCVEQLVRIVDPSLQMKAIDLLVLICANDSSLNLLAQHPVLVHTAEQWLTETSSLKRQANTALLIANMARTDEMCDVFIARGVVSHLIHLTQIEEPEELSGKVHVSALSALRNLCLPASHKLLLLEKGVLKAALACLRDSEWPHVHFKSLGIARLLANQQEEVCRECVLAQPGTVTLVCERCSSAEPAHVKIEGSRLLAALVKHCKSEQVMRNIISEGGVNLMASLLESEHVLLRNEALVALNLLATLRDGEGDEITASLLEEAVLLGVWGVVSSVDSSPELLANALTFLQQLTQSQTANVSERLCSLDGFVERMKVLSQHSNEAIRDKAKELIQNSPVHTQDS